MLRYTETCGGQNCARLDTCFYKTVDGGAVQEEEQGDEEGVEGASEGDCTLMTAVPGELE